MAARARHPVELRAALVEAVGGRSDVVAALQELTSRVDNVDTAPAAVLLLAAASVSAVDSTRAAFEALRDDIIC